MIIRVSSDQPTLVALPKGLGHGEPLVFSVKKMRSWSSSPDQ